MYRKNRMFVQGHARALTLTETAGGLIPALPLAFGLSAMLWVAVLATAQHYLASLL